MQVKAILLDASGAARLTSRFSPWTQPVSLSPLQALIEPDMRAVDAVIRAR
jgi:hypothetical protein